MHTLRSIWFGRCFAAALLIYSFSLASQAQTPPTAPAGKQTSIQPSITCSQPPTFDPTQVNFLAGDITSPLVQQIDVDCFAWQSFIAFNWPVDAGWPTDPNKAGEPDRTIQAKDWGTPQDPTKTALRPAAWETFKPVSDIFVAPGQTPTAWGVFSSAAQCSAAAQPGGNALSSHKLLTHTAKAGQLSPRRRSALFGKASGQGLGLGPNQINEAFGGWLTDQNGQLVWYELATNRAEFAYLLSPDGLSSDALYRQTGQTTVATNADNKHPNGLAFPAGQPPSSVIQTWDQLGAAEIKAAWRILTNLPQQWPRYHLSQAWLLDPVSQQCGQAVLGLVGLHIIRNTATFPNFFWATFEHVDNAPQTDGHVCRPVYASLRLLFLQPELHGQLHAEPAACRQQRQATLPQEPASAGDAAISNLSAAGPAQSWHLASHPDQQPALSLPVLSAGKCPVGSKPYASHHLPQPRRALEYVQHGLRRPQLSSRQHHHGNLRPIYHLRGMSRGCDHSR